MTLTNHPVIAGTAPSAWKESAYRLTGDPEGADDARADDFSATRFDLIIDEPGDVLGCVTERYALVQNRDLLLALDMAAEAEGMRLEPVSAIYQKGRSEYKFNLPQSEFKLPGDPSGQLGQIIVRNDYRGSGGLGILAGWFRMICSNGMVIGETAHSNLRRHVGEIDLYGFVQAGVRGIADRIATERVIAEALSAHGMPLSTLPYGRSRDEAKQAVKDGSTHPLDHILADTADRYGNYLRQAIFDNQLEMGESAWALVQAITQTSTHRMPGWAADEWATRQINRIKAEVVA